MKGYCGLEEKVLFSAWELGTKREMTLCPALSYMFSFNPYTVLVKILISMYRVEMRFRGLMYIDMNITVIGLGEFADKREFWQEKQSGRIK